MLSKNSHFQNRNCSSLSMSSLNQPKFISNTYNNYITNNLNMNTNNQPNKKEKEIQEIHIANFARILKKKNKDDKLLKLKNYCLESNNNISNSNNNIFRPKMLNSTQYLNFYGENKVYYKKNCKPLMHQSQEKKYNTTTDNYSRRTYTPQNKNINICNYSTSNTKSLNKLNNIYDKCKNSPFNLYQVHISLSASTREKTDRPRTSSTKINILDKAKVSQSTKNILRNKVDFINFNQKIEKNDNSYNDRYLKLIYELEKENRILKDIIKDSIIKKNPAENNNEMLAKYRKNQRNNIKGKIIDKKIQKIMNKTTQHFYKGRIGNKCKVNDKIDKNLFFKFTDELME